MEISRQRPLELTAFIQLCLGGKVVGEYEIHSPVVSVGRSTDCDIVIDNAAVSAFHAVLSQRDGKLLVEDAASTNGVMSDGFKKQAVELKPGEAVDIAGKYSIRLVTEPIGVATRVDAPKAIDEGQQHSTVLVDTATLAQLSQSARPAYLTLSSDKRNSWVVRLDKTTTTIGRGRDCDLRVGGLFTQAKVAVIEKRQDGYYLCIPEGREIELDGRRVNGELRLEEGNRLRVRELSGVFHERASARHWPFTQYSASVMGSCWSRMLRVPTA